MMVMNFGLIQMRVMAGLGYRTYCCFVAHFKIFMDTVWLFMLLDHLPCATSFVAGTAGTPEVAFVVSDAEPPAGEGVFPAMTRS